ncbi:YaiO family outer membrane beta-barrel protein [Fodinibius roseus]|nr:YaiO family outer membrane beta-barrel protein [Fodinibius roseus]
MKQFILFLLGFLLTGQGVIFAQSQVDRLSVEELYEQARNAAFEEADYDKARTYAFEALDRSPDYHGIRIFVARLYSWEGAYEKAREELRYVLQEDPGNRRALLALIDVEKWSDNLQVALQNVNEALDYHPEDEEILLQKAAVLYDMEEYGRSEDVYRDILARNPSKKARDELKSVKRKQMKYRVSISYRYDYFTDTFDPWEFGEFALSRQTPVGPVIGRVQYARRFGSNGAQFNIDAYPSIANGLYAYVSGGYSESSIYPRYRFGFSLYKALPASFELSAGMRYLDFSTSQTDIYTASLAKYEGSYLVTLRSNYVPSQGGNSKSINLLMRRYFGSATAYISVTGGYGSAPTEIQFSQDIQTLDSWSVGIDGQYPLLEHILVGGRARYDMSDLPSLTTRKRFSFKGSVSYRF